MDFSAGDQIYKVAYGMAIKERKYRIRTVQKVCEDGGTKWIAEVEGEAEPYLLAHRRKNSSPHIVIYASRCYT